jgi:DNA-directed RNA polymerase alpha subunit
MGTEIVPVAELGLGTRSRNALLRDGYRTAGDVAAVTAEDLLDIRHFGTGMLADVQEALARAGLALKEAAR